MTYRLPHILGSGLDALACSLRLTQLSVHHAWSPETSPGSHFGGWMTKCRNERRVDLGMVLLEPGPAISASTHFSEYSCQEGPEARSFLPGLMSWIQETALVPLHSHPVYTMLRGKLFPDFFIADNLEALSSFTRAELKTIRGELLTASSEGREIRPSSKDHEQQTLGDALMRSVGPTIYREFFGTYLSLFPAAETLPFQLHRQLWLPMYWTQSIEEAVISRRQPFPPARFLAPANSSVAQMVQGFSDQATSSKYRHSGVPPQQSDKFLDFRPGSSKPANSVEYAVVHFCVKSQDERSTVFFADVPNRVTRLSFYPTGTNANHPSPSDYVVALEIPSSDGLSEKQLIDDARLVLRETGTNPCCEGAVKRLKFGYGQPDSPTGLCGGTNFNETLLRGLSAAEQLVSKL